jgi:hypothetical protein
VFGRDFCQVLLIIVKGSKGQIVVASLCKSMLWQGVHLLKLQQNMCLATTSQENHQFAHWLLKVGSGEIQIDEERCIPLPQQIIHGQDLQSFIQVVYIVLKTKMHILMNISKTKSFYPL